MIFANVHEHDEKAVNDISICRISIDCKATVNIGDYARGGKSRGDNQALDHDTGCTEKYTPFGILDEDEHQLTIEFGSSFKTSDFIVDSLQNWWGKLPTKKKKVIKLIQIKSDNGPESSGRRTQFLKRMVEFVDRTHKSVHLLYYPPYHSKYNPIERCWGVLEQHWNGALLSDRDLMLGWAGSMKWKGTPPIISLNQKWYRKGLKLGRNAMKAIENRLERHPQLPKWDVLIKPVCR